MQLSELKLVTAGNIIKLRTGRGLTQAELGAMLNYSDKPSPSGNGARPSPTPMC